MTTKAKKSRSLHPSLLVASRIQRLLEPLTIESRRTVLHFVHQSVEESFQEEQRVALTELGQQASMDFERSGLANGKTATIGPD